MRPHEAAPHLKESARFPRSGIVAHRRGVGREAGFVGRHHDENRPYPLVLHLGVYGAKEGGGGGGVAVRGVERTGKNEGGNHVAAPRPVDVPHQRHT